MTSQGLLLSSGVIVDQQAQMSSKQEKECEQYGEMEKLLEVTLMMVWVQSVGHILRVIA